MARWEVRGRDEETGMVMAAPLYVRGATDQEAVREAARRGVVADEVKRMPEDGRNGNGSERSGEALRGQEMEDVGEAGGAGEGDQAADLVENIERIRETTDHLRQNALARAPMAVCIVAVLSGWMAQWMREAAQETGWLRECDAVIFFAFIGFCFFAARGGRGPVVGRAVKPGDGRPARLRKPQ